MGKFFKEFFELCGRNKKSLLTTLAIILIAIVAVGGVLSYKISQSSICDSCHYMDPYVRHWGTSNHAEVDCVKCHEYGVLDLTRSAFKLVVGVYDRRPKADVLDESCLDADCHAGHDQDENTVYHKNIAFSHAKHNNQVLRGEKLRCTSCHNQIVQYEDESAGHMSVNNKACFVCHFKDAGVGESITGCNSCHGMPETKVEHGGFTFDHEPYLKLEVECKQCHTNIVKGDGAVPERKCYACHVERSRQELTRQELHDWHVTERGIDCYECHTDIEHGNFEMASALEIQCENCHLRQHNQPKQLYMGIGGRDTLDMPSGMFAAQVSCTGCHTHITPEGEIMAHQEKKEASRQSCVTCHGQGYELMFDNWLEGSKKVISDYRILIRAAEADYNSIGGNKKKRVAVRETLSKMKDNYNFVREGHIPHNIQYALYLLNASVSNFELAMKDIRKSYKAPAVPASVKKENSCLTFCHGKTLFPETVDYDGSDLPHLMHVEDMEVGCESCHSVEKHGETKINEEKCGECH